MIEKKIQDAVDGAMKRLAEEHESCKRTMDAIRLDAEAGIVALLTLVKDFPITLDSILERCNGGKSFIVQDVEVCGDVRALDFEIYGSRGCGPGRRQVNADGGILLPGPKDFPKDVHGNEMPHKVRVVIMLMPVAEEKEKP